MPYDKLYAILMALDRTVSVPLGVSRSSTCHESAILMRQDSNLEKAMPFALTQKRSIEQY